MKRRDFLKHGVFGAATTAVGIQSVAGRQYAGVDLDSVTHAAIYPSIGIARIGNSEEAWFLGPEVPGVFPSPENGFKDATGRIMPQAARFRVYGFDDDGNVIAELTADQAEIEWTVHLANTKAAWYDFDVPLDIPGAMGEPAAPLQTASPPVQSGRRNASVSDSNRDQLIIDPGTKSIGGAGINNGGGDPSFALDGGRFFDKPVTLGELRTDDRGRLLVFGGRGISRPAVPGLQASTFANNDLWHDDTADGPIDARVVIDGEEIPVTGAWAVVAPPNYGPGLQSVVTMYDVMFEVATQLQPDRAPERPSFTRQIYPLFERIVQNQWVNAGFFRDFGWGSGSDFLKPDTLALLGDRSEGSRFMRQQVFERFRDPAYLSMEFDDIPPYYGDGIELPVTNPRQWMAILPIQYGWLRQWAEGDFDADWPEAGLAAVDALEGLPLAEQPEALNRAVLDDCLGGPFHPGCEMTWPMRHASLYESPFRLRRRKEVEPDWGDVMTSEIALGEDGPLTASGPGAVTRWMAVPWQTDTSSCLSRYIEVVDEYLPTFWPAHVPNDVLAEESYRVALDDLAPLEDRQAAFATRVKWLRPFPNISDAYIDRINAFIDEWDRAGIVTAQPGDPEGDFPETFWVELGHALTDPRKDEGTPVAVEATPSSG